MKIFVTGVAGQLGHDVMNELAKRGHRRNWKLTSHRFTAESLMALQSPLCPMSLMDITRCRCRQRSAGARTAGCCHPLCCLDSRRRWQRMKIKKKKSVWSMRMAQTTLPRSAKN